ncbi:MAG: dephospho-CoA kinase [Firmicutes bacterium]|nr:dephospho-CoA kinase [Bacillota bacterium]MDD7601933.1 dephospho-CoA kinase [Bacillota bacterium]MDY5855949.1 dephospho-CoA kinase [Anaerovoracaceae bacterium]
MKIIGLTGGIGSGKSTVSSYLRKKNIPIVDADQISRELTAPESPVLSEIRILLGENAFHADGSLDRQAVADMIFSNTQLRNRYENLITRETAERCLAQLRRLAAQKKWKAAVLDAPLLFECGMEKYTDENWLVDADLATRLFRVQQRDGISEEKVMDRIRVQMNDSEKAARADEIIDNSGSLEQLYAQIDRLLERIGYER